MDDQLTILTVLPQYPAAVGQELLLWTPPPPSMQVSKDSSFKMEGVRG